MRPRSLLGLLFVALALTGGPVRAEPAGAIALLPLDADARLEIYGQPVASEIARALVAGAVDVVVVGPKMLVPERAKLIVDGTIATGKGDAVVLSIRVRDPRDGTVLQTLSATAPTLSSIDRAAAELSGRVLPIVRDKLAALASEPVPAPPQDPIAKPPATPRAAAPVIRPILLAVGLGKTGKPGTELLRAALATAAPSWVRAHQHAAELVEPAALAVEVAPTTVAARAADRAIAFEVVGYEVTSGAVPLARARVRVRIVGSSAVIFDRVVVTDTVVGDKRMPAGALAERVAREVLAILRPHVHREVAGWR